MTTALRHTNSVFHEGNNQFKGQGISKWCALCGVHRPIQNGTIQHVLGGRHFCCAKHPDPKDAKCKTPRTATQPKSLKKTTLIISGSVKPKPKNKKLKSADSKTIPTKKMKADIAAAALEVVKVSMTALAAPLVVDVAKSAESATPTTSLNPIRTTWRHINGPL